MSKSIKNLSNQVLLCILDGFGKTDIDLKNAIKHASTPNLDRFYNQYANTTLKAGGIPVGLPKGVSGNSEVGHLNLGAGRPVRQDLVRINEAIKNDTFKNMEQFQKLLTFAKTKNKLHIMGLLSDGGVHSHIDHIKYIIQTINKLHPEITVYFHAFMDGRDTLKTDGINYIKQLQTAADFVFASMQGRSIGMDRDRRWEKIERAYKMMIGESNKSDLTPTDYIQNEYNQEIYDEFITPTLFTEKGKIESSDALFFINFRPDRAKQITLAFNDPDFKEFKRDVIPGFYLCMSPYVYDELPNLPVLFDKEKIDGTLGEYLASKNLKQFRTAETEKFAHVTYFFNGGATKPFPGEERLLIDSPKDVKTYDEKPEMSAPEVLKNLLQKLDDNSISFFLVNFANPDMVGHTGNYEAAVKAIEYIDFCIGELEKKCLKNGITLFITADHGNSDQMIYEDGNPHTSHSANDVPFIMVTDKLEKNEIIINKDIDTPALKDVAPTVLEVLNLPYPDGFTGQPLFN